MEVANKVVFVGSSLWHRAGTTRVQTSLRGSQAPAPFHTRRCTSYEGSDRELRRFPFHTTDVAGCLTLVLPLGQSPRFVHLDFRCRKFFRHRGEKSKRANFRSAAFPMVCFAPAVLATSWMRFAPLGSAGRTCLRLDNVLCIRDVEELLIGQKRRMELAGTWRAVQLESDTAKPRMRRA